MSIMDRVYAAAADIKKDLAYREVKSAGAFVKEHGCPALTKDERAEIDRYWAQYHVRFRNYDWHRMYYSATGIRDPRFIPQPFADTVLYQHYKRMSFAAAYADKNMFSFLLPELKFPTAIGSRVNGRYYDAEGVCCGEEVTDGFADKIYRAFAENNGSGTGSVIVKQAISSSFGKGVQKKPVASSGDVKRLLLENKSKDFIIQMTIRQHPFFAKLNPDSVNIIRITTWRKGNEVHLLAPCVRYGIKGSHTDVAFVNGKEILNVVSIDPSGRLGELAVNLDGERTPIPETPGKTIPSWDKVVEAAKTGALRLKHFDIVAWDFTVDESGEPVCIEYNLQRPGILIYQFAQGPLAGELTDELLSFLKDESSAKLLPPCIRKN